MRRLQHSSHNMAWKSHHLEPWTHRPQMPALDSKLDLTQSASAISIMAQWAPSWMQEQAHKQSWDLQQVQESTPLGGTLTITTAWMLAGPSGLPASSCPRSRAHALMGHMKSRCYGYQHVTPAQSCKREAHTILVTHPLLSRESLAAVNFWLAFQINCSLHQWTTCLSPLPSPPPRMHLRVR